MPDHDTTSSLCSHSSSEYRATCLAKPGLQLPTQIVGRLKPRTTYSSGGTAYYDTLSAGMLVDTASQWVDTPYENSLGMREIRGRIAGSSAAVMLGGSQDAHLGPRLSKVGLVELAGLTTPEQGSCWEGYCLVHAFPSGTHSVASRKGLGAMLHPFPQSGPASSVTIKLKTQSGLVFPAHRHTSTGVTYQPVLCKHNMIDLIIEGCLQGLEQAQKPFWWW